MDQAKVRKILMECFSEGELRTLCFDLGVDYDVLPGSSKADKARELVGYFWRRGQGMTLLETVRDLRPRARWNGALSRALRESVFETQEIPATAILRKMGETGKLGVDYRTLLELSQRMSVLAQRVYVAVVLALVAIVMVMLVLVVLVIGY